MSTNYDYIVVGCGGIGSATLYWLSKLAPGAKILGLEQFELGHVKGGSEDYSRIVRQSIGYTDTPVYQSIAKHIWTDLESETGLQMVHRCGGICFTDRNSGAQHAIMQQLHESNATPAFCRKVTAEDMRKLWPQLKLGEEALGVYEPGAGLVDAAMANAAHRQRARHRGATIVANAKVYGVDKLADGRDHNLVVHASCGDFLCKKLIVTAGAWLNQVLRATGVQIPVRVTQENVTYFDTGHLKPFTKENFPVFIYKGRTHDVYALPAHSVPRFKIGVDAGGKVVTGDTRTFVVDKDRERYIVEFVKKYVPQALGPVHETKTCLYTMTVDRHFVVDSLRTAGWPNVLVCCGAGHAFKFAAILGRSLAQLALNQHCPVDLSHFRVDRPAVTDPHFPWWQDTRNDVAAGAKSRL